MQNGLGEILEQIVEPDIFDVRCEIRRTQEDLTLMRMVVTSADEILDEVIVSDYGAYIFVRMLMSGWDLCSLLQEIGRQDGTKFDVAGRFKGVSCPWSPSSMQYEFERLSRGQWYGFQRRNYPARFYQAYQDVERAQSSGEEKELNGPGLPFFRSLEEAETFYLFGSVLETANPVRRVLQIVIDDKRAWIERISVGDAGLQILIKGNFAEMCEVKLSGKRPGFVGVVSAVEAMRTGISLETLPAELHVCLSMGREIVDQRFISEQASMYSPTEGVSYERDEQVSIEGIIRLRGESIHHDYKETFTQKIFATVCAFANTEGGSVLIGIDDCGNVIGVDEPDKTRLKIENFLEDHAIGTIDRRYVFHELQGAEGREVVVLELSVREAQTKPVAIRDKDKEKYYVRRDGSNRPMKREDIVHMINQAVERSKDYLVTNSLFWMR